MRFLGVLALGLSLAAAPAWAEDTPFIFITGQGKVAATPDMAMITLGVRHTDKDAADAMDAVSAEMRGVIASLKAAGIAPTDIQTQTLSLSPNWVQRSTQDGAQVDGFVAENGIVVNVRDMGRLGIILDDVIEVGANSFRGVRFDIQNPEPLEDDARRAAVADAMRKADLFATAAGVKLGSILAIEEGFVGRPQVVMMREAASFAGDMPVESGEVSVEASVTIRFAISGQ